MNVPSSWPRLYVPVCPLHDVDVPLAHVPDHTWVSMSAEQWSVNLEMYATRPGRLLKLQCEGECWCNPPDARANSWAGHERGPTACRFEALPFDERLARALAVARQAQAVGLELPISEPTLILEVVSALAHQPGFCTCLASMLTRVDQLPDHLSRRWSFGTFPSADPAVESVRRWIDALLTPREGFYLWGGVGRGKTGLAASAARQFLAVDPARTGFYGRVTMVREELVGEAGAVLAAWLAAVDLLILDDLDFGWSWTSPGDRGGVLLAECLRTRLARGLPVMLTAHVGVSELSEDVDPAVRLVLTELPWSSVALSEGPSLRTGRQW